MEEGKAGASEVVRECCCASDAEEWTCFSRGSDRKTLWGNIKFCICRRFRGHFLVHQPLGIPHPNPIPRSKGFLPGASASVYSQGCGVACPTKSHPSSSYVQVAEQSRRQDLLQGDPTPQGVGAGGMGRCCPPHHPGLYSGVQICQSMPIFPIKWTSCICENSLLPTVDILALFVLSQKPFVWLHNHGKKSIALSKSTFRGVTAATQKLLTVQPWPYQCPFGLSRNCWDRGSVSL